MATEQQRSDNPLPHTGQSPGESAMPSAVGPGMAATTAHDPAVVQEMADKSDFIILETLRSAYLPEQVADRGEALVVRAVELLADSLSARGASELADWIGGRLGEAAGRRTDKVEHNTEEWIQLLAKEGGVSPHSADDLIGALLPALWLALGRDRMEILISQVPADVARGIQAAFPGQKRGSF